MSAEEYITHMLNELMSGFDHPSRAYDTRGILAVVREALSGCRWELLQEAHATLGRLIGAMSTE